MFWTTEGLIRFPIHVVMGQKYFDTSGVVKVYEYTGYHNTGRITKWFHIRVRAQDLLYLLSLNSISVGNVMITFKYYL